MNTSTRIIAHIAEITGNRAGDRCEKVRVTATYESSNIMGSISFDVPIAEAVRIYVGQALTIVIEHEENPK